MQATVLDTKSASSKETFETGFTALQVFFEKVSTSIYLVSPQALPPTTAGTTKYHCLKVDIQIRIEWEACTNKVSPLDWGGGRDVVEN